MQSHRYNSWSLCWHQDASAVLILTCLPRLRWLGLSVSWWRGIQRLSYDSEEDNTQPGFQKCHWDPKRPLAFLWGCCFWGFPPCKSTRIIHNEEASGEWRKALNISASFPVYRLVGIGAKSSVAPSLLMLKDIKSFVVNVDHTKEPGGEGRDVQESAPYFTALDHCVPTSPCPRAKPSQTTAKRVSMHDKTWWTPALLSDWHTDEVASGLRWLSILRSRRLTTAALLLLLLILWLLSALKSLSLLASKGWMLPSLQPGRLAGCLVGGWQGFLCS